ncbi:manganese-dependent inorganic pyrophosphatase [Ferrimonas sp. SCSIO 43195]|uniref:manganese-dependent inorganic pyrophosphatase n=1 Tax=Ferrimonas sp. SCSIO 43195 TaxID=2822844 RepID=UPI002074D81A|nr:manganese-dependent inorganic pyrophosphatase [Ferrimonas sp. SCSIO 43195]USD36617.1 manganese-dependent inorganic pyrophosphatase [Ferrimonas sp. SCSIO 43195]
MINVFGHKSPDSDCVCSAVIATHWLGARGKQATPFRLGEISRETQFIFDFAGVEVPPLLEKPLKGEQVYLVDYSEAEQAPDDINDADLVGIVDHHRLGTLTSAAPLEAWLMPLGSSASVLFELCGIHNVEIPQPMARLMIGALLSDTVGLKSPTTTERDAEIVELLAPLAGVEVEPFLADLLAAKTNVEGLSTEALLDKDVKGYEIAGKSTNLGQLELADYGQVEHELANLQALMDQRVTDKGLDLIALMLTNIRTEETTLMVAGPLSDTIKNANNGSLVFEGFLSRKKQMLPWVTQVLAG